MVAGYPPCPYIDQFCNARAQEYGIDAITGTTQFPTVITKSHILGNLDHARMARKNQAAVRR